MEPDNEDTDSDILTGSRNMWKEQSSNSKQETRSTESEKRLWTSRSSSSPFSLLSIGLMLQFDENIPSAVDNNAKKRPSDPFKPVIKEVAFLRKSSEPKEQSRRKLRGHSDVSEKRPKSEKFTRATSPTLHREKQYLRNREQYIDYDLLKHRERPKYRKDERSKRASRTRGGRMFFRFFMFPFYASWWKQRLSAGWTFMYNIVYLSHVISCTIYYNTESNRLGQIGHFQIYLPIVLLTLVSVFSGYSAASIPSFLYRTENFDTRSNFRSTEKQNNGSDNDLLSSQVDEGDDNDSFSDSSESDSAVLDGDESKLSEDLSGKGYITLDDRYEVKSVRFEPNDYYSKVRLTVQEIRDEIEQKINVSYFTFCSPTWYLGS
mmetsp:Transcript_14521/g.16473  ORF Transcript_14521/g.16473 Transcript_14521/m.16473 type:complete len:376 (-) Transcript_14521:1535-2662(-)